MLECDRSDEEVLLKFLRHMAVQKGKQGMDLVNHIHRQFDDIIEDMVLVPPFGTLTYETTNGCYVTGKLTNDSPTTVLDLEIHPQPDKEPRIYGKEIRRPCGDKWTDRTYKTSKMSYFTRPRPSGTVHHLTLRFEEWTFYLQLKSNGKKHIIVSIFCSGRRINIYDQGYNETFQTAPLSEAVFDPVAHDAIKGIFWNIACGVEKIITSELHPQYLSIMSILDSIDEQVAAVFTKNPL